MTRPPAFEARSERGHPGENTRSIRHRDPATTISLPLRPAACHGLTRPSPPVAAAAATLRSVFGSPAVIRLGSQR